MECTVLYFEIFLQQVCDASEVECLLNMTDDGMHVYCVVKDFGGKKLR